MELTYNFLFYIIITKYTFHANDNNTIIYKINLFLLHFMASNTDLTTNTIKNYNRQILTSIFHNGLIPRKSQKIYCISSRDGDSYNHSSVFLNLFYPQKNDFCHSNEWFKQGMQTLLRSPANGFFPLILERPLSQEISHNWIYFEKDHSSFAAKVSSVFCNNIVLECNFEKLPKPAKGYNFDSECHRTGGCREFSFSKKVPPDAFVRAFVPQNLVPIFRECFPLLQCVSVENRFEQYSVAIPSEVSKDPKFQIEKSSAGFSNFFGKTFREITATLPNYASHIEKSMKAYFGDLCDCKELSSKQPLAFHIVRLASEEDLPFLDIKDISNITSSSSHLKEPIHSPLLFVHHNAGWGNTLYMRGAWENLSHNGEGKDLEGLSWDKDIPLRCVSNEEWILETKNPIESKFEFKIVKKNMDGDIFWEKDTSESRGNHSYDPVQGKLVINPLF